MTHKKRVVLIGTGGRVNGYTRHGAKEQVELVACADPSADNRRTFLGLNDLVGRLAEFEDWRDMLDATPDVDAAVITTPNHLHADPAVECMRRGFVIALEKPIAESPESCRRILDAKREHGARVLVGFQMRSAPFYLQAKEWVDQGRIGEVVSINATEFPHEFTTSLMFRSDWRRFKQTSGGSLLEKCCHDIDMLTWLAGGVPETISSMAGEKTLGPNPDRPALCADCALTEACTYYLPPETYNLAGHRHVGEDGVVYRYSVDNSACIYNNGHDIYDHQQVQIAYDNGVIASLTMDFSTAGSISGRTLTIVGTHGVIHGKFEDMQIAVQDKRTNESEVAHLRDDGSGHGGIDSLHCENFRRMLDDPDFEPKATVEAGFLSAMLCFAADQSVQERRQVDVSSLMEDAGLR